MKMKIHSTFPETIHRVQELECAAAHDSRYLLIYNQVYQNKYNYFHHFSYTVTSFIPNAIKKETR